jgi:hypothetical protein
VPGRVAGGSPAGARMRRTAGAGVRPASLVLVVLAALTLLASPSSARAGEASQIVEKCAHGESVGGYTQNAYRQALKQLPTIAIEYSECVNEIHKAELAAAGGGAGSSAPGASSSVALPLAPSEQRAVQDAHRSGGSKPVQVGG